jgi:hypothetical protein
MDVFKIGFHNGTPDFHNKATTFINGAPRNLVIAGKIIVFIISFFCETLILPENG